MTREFDQQLTIGLYVRADTPIVERRDAVIDRLKQLDRQDRIAGFRIHPWPRAISLDLMNEIEEDEIHEVVRSFETWAAQHDRHISPPFDIHPTHSAITGESDELLVLPVICIAAYDAGDLVGVAPSSDGKSVRTVEDALNAIEAGKAPVPEPQPEGEASSLEREQGGSTKVTEQPLDLATR